MNQENDRIMNNIIKTVALFGEKITEIVGEYSQYFIENVVPALSAFYEPIPDLSDEQKEELHKFAKTLLNNGWCMFDFLPIVVYTQDLSSQEKADAYIMEYCTTENIDRIYDTLLEGGVTKEDVYNIQSCYNNEAYKACASLLISIIEHYIVCECKITENPLLKEKATEKLKNVYNEVPANKISIYFYLHNYSLYLGAKEVFRDIKDITNVDDSDFAVPSRHCLLHGYSKRKYTRKDCLFLLLLLYGFVKQKEILTDRL